MPGLFSAKLSADERSSMNLFWQFVITGGAIVVASIIIGWAAETAQIYISQGLALAILAWLQTSPEFAVEAVIAWHQQTELMVANLTGSLRLLVGLGWPLVYFTNAFLGTHRKTGWPVLRLPWFNALEVFSLLAGTLYFIVIWFKGTLTVYDSIFLLIIYFLYLFELMRLPRGDKESEDDLPAVGKKILKLKSPRVRWFAIASLFVMGGLILRFSVGPFLTTLEAVAAAFGISSFFFIQWVAPFLSEFPEKVTAFNWARTGKKAPMALVNMSASNIVQWTLMAGLIPVIYNVSKGELAPIIFDKMHREEIAITILQSLLSIGFLMDLELNARDAFGLFVLWAIQFFVPSSRHMVMILYVLWGLFEYIALAARGKLLYALREFIRGRRRAS
jgi:cation:H+ antiporter